MEIRPAKLSDLPAICAFYEQVCQQQANDEYGADWHWGIYPSKQGLQSALTDNFVIIGLINGQIVSAAVLTKGEDPAYSHVHWLTHAANSAVTVLHLFAVDKASRGQGVSKQMLSWMCQFAKQQGFTIMHLDVMKGNLPAQKAYEHFGFKFVEEALITYQDDGETPALLYEKIL
ncbi:MAG: GNAT family N-acetyltransferase [Lactobacillus sp.]|nr:GNAT family N-acetyltransferase [Lactobacillus sp.]